MRCSRSSAVVISCPQCDETIHCRILTVLADFLYNLLLSPYRERISSDVRLVMIQASLPVDCGFKPCSAHCTP